ASLDLAGAAILELSPDLDAAIVRAAAGRLPKSLDLRQAQPVQNWSSLEQAIDQGDLVLTPLDAAADDLTYQIMAPLKAGDRFSGVLVLWDTQAELTKDDVGFVRPLALFLGGSWQNVRLLAQSEGRARELEMMHGARIQEMWSKSKITTQQTRLERSRKGYVYDGVGVSPIVSETNGPEITEQNANSGDALSMPIQMRDFPVGKLIIPASDSNPLGQDDQVFVEAVVREMTGALENANLILDTQRRARREQTIREITEKMRAATSLEQLVKTTAEELGEHLSAGHAVVELGFEKDTIGTNQ
ncbi:MAG TPA: hypothetical protein G4N96_09670, partial [Chloroflexi bacterium]|nr:hypothetical protein [Chloroflexota bacterium]